MLDIESVLILEGMVASNTGGVHATGVSSGDSIRCFPLGGLILGSFSCSDIARPFILFLLSVSAQIDSVGVDFREAGCSWGKVFSRNGTAALRSRADGRIPRVTGFRVGECVCGGLPKADPAR